MDDVTQTQNLARDLPRLVGHAPAKGDVSVVLINAAGDNALSTSFRNDPDMQWADSDLAQNIQNTARSVDANEIAIIGHGTEGLANAKQLEDALGPTDARVSMTQMTANKVREVHNSKPGHWQKIPQQTKTAAPQAAGQYAYMGEADPSYVPPSTTTQPPRTTVDGISPATAPPELSQPTL